MDPTANQKASPPKNDVVYQIQDEEAASKSRFSKETIIKVGIGLIAVVVLVIIIFTLIIPFVRSLQGEKITLKYWGLWEDDSILENIFTDFEREHPNIDVVYEKQDIKTLGKYMDRLSSRIQNNTGPDIFRYHNSWLFAVDSLLLPLPSDVVSVSELDKNYYAVVKEDLNRNGAYYGIPLGIDTLALFVNNDIFSAAGITSAPQTWDDFVKVARQLTVKDEQGAITTAGASLGTYDNVSHASDIVSLLFIQNGADLKDLAGRKKQNAEDALAFYASFAQDESKVWDDSMDSSKLAFAKGQVAMYFGYSWDIFEIKKANPDLNFSIAVVPHVSGVNPDRTRTIASYWAEGVSVKSTHSKEAFELLKFLSKKETLEKMYSSASKVRLFGEPYPRSDMKDLLKDNDFVYPFVQQAENASSTFFSSDTYDEGIISALNAYLANAVRGVLTGTSSPSAIETLSQGVTQNISKYEN